MNNRDAVKIIAESIDSYLTEIDKKPVVFDSISQSETGSVKHSIKKLPIHAQLKIADGFIDHCEGACKNYEGHFKNSIEKSTSNPNDIHNQRQYESRALHMRDAANAFRKAKEAMTLAALGHEHPEATTWKK